MSEPLQQQSNPQSNPQPNSQAIPRDEQVYKQAERAMQSGQWDEASPLIEGLLRRYPADAGLQSMLNECRLKAEFERTTLRVKPKQSTINWRRVISSVVMLVVVALVLLLGVIVVQVQVLPIFAETETLERLGTMHTQAQIALAEGRLDDAEELFDKILVLEPGATDAASGLVRIARERELLTIYNEALALVQANDLAAALSRFNDLQLEEPNYRDTNSQVLAIRKQQQLETLYAQAQIQIQLGYSDLALATLNEIRSASTTFRCEEIREAIFALNLQQGQTLVNQMPADPAVVPVALDHFNEALKQRPSSVEVTIEQRLALNYLAGRDGFEHANWSTAVTRLHSVYTERPTYLGASVPPLLYTSLINNGDLFRVNDDLYKAYDQYQMASMLPVSDTVVARGRMAEIQPLLTPTPTPAATATTGPPAPAATPTPTATPRPLLLFQGRIVFKSDNPDQPGYWIMDANGGNREYLGSFELYESVVDAYRATERLSPDGQYRVQVGDVDKRAQVLLAKPFEAAFAPRPLTRLTGIAYDPVWAPDGSMIAFVTQENESDDIWLISPDSSVQESIVRNQWEWDKHPSWSPDSTRIAFTSNREGQSAIWIMERTGRNPRNISNVTWAEYDPVWVK